MTTNLTSRSICAIALGAWAAVASALSLGPLTGATEVGRPLALVAPIQFDEAVQASSDGCVTAQVMYGDRVVDRPQVVLDLSPDTARQVSYARISSSVAVDEPFVTVVLNAGCTRPYSKRYVLLAEAPRQEPMVLASAVSLVAPAPARTEAVAPVAAIAPRVVPPAAVSRQAPAQRADRPAPVRRVAAAPREAAPRAPGRLQLAVWDPATEQLPWLRASTELRSSPTADEARRAAATSLWRALNAQPQDLLRTAERLRGLEGEINSLRTLSARHRADIASARESLQGARQRDHTSLLVVTLLALLAGGAAAWVFHRSRRPARTAAHDSWYGPLEPWNDPAGDSPGIPAVAAGLTARVAPVVRPEAVPHRPEPPPLVAPVVVPQAVEPMLPDLTFPIVEPAPTAVLPAVTSQAPGMKVEALQAAQQQSEFFASLGQVDEAAAVLTSYLEESRERPPLAYLELLRIYRGTGLPTEYDAARAAFRDAFGMDPGSFDEFSEEPRELDLYLLPVTRIASAWPSERSLEVIEDLLFRRPASSRDLLSLHAYRDLIWLHGLCEEIVQNTGLPAGLQLQGNRGLSNDHFILPWAESEEHGPTELSLARLDTIDVAPELSAFAVDIDLTAIRADSHPASEQVRPGIPPPPEPPSLEFDAFDAAMESDSRRSR